MHACVCEGAHACVHVQVIKVNTMKLPWTDLNCLKIIFRFFLSSSLPLKSGLLNARFLLWLDTCIIEMWDNVFPFR